MAEAGEPLQDVLDVGKDDGNFSVHRLIQIVESALRPDGKIDLTIYIQTHEQYARLILKLYGFMGRIVANTLRSGSKSMPDFLDSHNVPPNERTPEKILELSDLEKVKARDHAQAGYLLAVENSFLSWALRLYKEKDEPEAPGGNFLRESYHATYGQFHPWYQQKAADFLFSLHKGKEHWKKNFLGNQDLFPEGTLERIIEAYSKVRDSFVEALRSNGLDELVFV